MRKVQKWTKSAFKPSKMFWKGIRPRLWESLLDEDTGCNMEDCLPPMEDAPEPRVTIVGAPRIRSEVKKNQRYSGSLKCRRVLTGGEKSPVDVQGDVDTLSCEDPSQKCTRVRSKAESRL